jgi:hypothetical protein
MGAYGMTPNVIDLISSKAVMVSPFFGLVGCLPPSEQLLWFPNQAVYKIQQHGHYRN